MPRGRLGLKPGSPRPQRSPQALGDRAEARRIAPFSVRVARRDPFPSHSPPRSRLGGGRQTRAPQRLLRTRPSPALVPEPNADGQIFSFGASRSRASFRPAAAALARATLRGRATRVPDGSRPTEGTAAYARGPDHLLPFPSLPLLLDRCPRRLKTPPPTPRGECRGPRRPPPSAPRRTCVRPITKAQWRRPLDPPPPFFGLGGVRCATPAPLPLPRPPPHTPRPPAAGSHPFRPRLRVQTAQQDHTEKGPEARLRAGRTLRETPSTPMDAPSPPSPHVPPRPAELPRASTPAKVVDPPPLSAPGPRLSRKRPLGDPEHWVK